MRRALLILPLFAAPSYAEEPSCVIPRGPPCISIRDPRLKDKNCKFEEESCFSFEWDEYGDIIIESAEILVTQICGKESTFVELEKKGKDYLDTLQTIPIEKISVVKTPCTKSKGFVDVKITKYRVDSHKDLSEEKIPPVEQESTNK